MASRIEALEAPIVEVPHTNAVGSRQELAVIPSVEDVYPTEDGISTGIPCGNANEGDAPDNPSSWEDIVALLKRVSYFTALESSTSGVHAFFSYFRRQFVELPSGVFDVVRPSYDTREFVLQCTYPM
ncbi:hypothetical protein AAG906_025626 [Vitis piasezkii]